jgi:hypothetical protein
MLNCAAGAHSPKKIHLVSRTVQLSHPSGQIIRNAAIPRDRRGFTTYDNLIRIPHVAI